MAPLPPTAQRAAQLFKEKVLHQVGPRIEKLVVFGSRARGDERADSDLDILILVDRRDLQLDRQIIDAACDVEIEMGFPFQVAPRIMSSQHYLDLLGRELKLARDIEAEGIPL
jgi:predicted nucleotidyltransferase